MRGGAPERDDGDQDGDHDQAGDLAALEPLVCVHETILVAMKRSAIKRLAKKRSAIKRVAF